MANAFKDWTPSMVELHNDKISRVRARDFSEKKPQIETAESIIGAPTGKELRAKAKVKLPKKRSHLEVKFLRLWKEAGGPNLAEELRFAPPRRWRFDFAHVASKTAFEIQGGNWTNGAHNRGGGMERDCEKAFAAWELGWRVVLLTPNMINGGVVGMILMRINDHDHTREPKISI